MLGNPQAGRPDGKWNREQTADGRVSGTGKGETVVQETTSAAGDRGGSPNPTGSKAEQGPGGPSDGPG